MKYDDIEYNTCSQVYEPAEDTFLLIDNLEIDNGSSVVEIGTGTGIVSIAASFNARNVVAVDINKYAISCARENIKLNNRDNIEVIYSDLFENINDKYDLILFNTPYLPVCEKEDDIYSKSWDGGSDGRCVIDRFLKEVDKYLKSHGKIQLVQSSLSNNDKTLDYLNNNGFNASVNDSLHMFFEDITLINAIKKH